MVHLVACYVVTMCYCKGLRHEIWDREEHEQNICHFTPGAIFASLDFTLSENQT